jgi:phage shock protein PspC (stress-responsive transcriptional regulator)
MIPAEGTRVRRRQDVLSTTSGGETLLVDQSSGSVHVINPTAAMIWELCSAEPTVEGVIAGLAERYGMAPAEVRDDVLEMLRTFGELGVVELVPAA